MLLFSVVLHAEQERLRESAAEANTCLIIFRFINHATFHIDRTAFHAEPEFYLRVVFRCRCHAPRYADTMMRHAYAPRAARRQRFACAR